MRPGSSLGFAAVRYPGATQGDETPPR
jgi:hypothetical protein